MPEKQKIGEFTKFIFSQVSLRIVAFATPIFYCICYTTHRDEVSHADKRYSLSIDDFAPFSF